MADFCQFRICIIKGVGQETGADRTMLHVTSRTSKYRSLILYLIFVKYIPPHVYKTHWLLGQVEQTLYVNCAGEFHFATLTNNEPHVIGCFSYFCNIFVWGGFSAKITFTKFLNMSLLVDDFKHFFIYRILWGMLALIFLVKTYLMFFLLSLVNNHSVLQLGHKYYAHIVACHAI